MREYVLFLKAPDGSIGFMDGFTSLEDLEETLKHYEQLGYTLDKII